MGVWGWFGWGFCYFLDCFLVGGGVVWFLWGVEWTTPSLRDTPPWEGNPPAIFFWLDHPVGFADTHSGRRAVLGAFSSPLAARGSATPPPEEGNPPAIFFGSV